MKNKIRTPTSRRDRKRRAFALMSIIFCFLYLVVGASAADPGAHPYDWEVRPYNASEITDSDLRGWTTMASIAYTLPGDSSGTDYLFPDYMTRQQDSTGPIILSPQGQGSSSVTNEGIWFEANTENNTLFKPFFCVAIVTESPELYKMSVGNESAVGQADFEMLEKTYPIGSGRSVVLGFASFVYDQEANKDYKIGLAYTGAYEPGVSQHYQRLLFTTVFRNGPANDWMGFQDYNTRLAKVYYPESTEEGGESRMTALLTEIIQLLFGGLTGAATALGGGANTFVTALFVGENNTLATYGGLVVIFAGVALAIGFTTRIFTWLTSLGN